MISHKSSDAPDRSIADTREERELDDDKVDGDEDDEDDDVDGDGKLSNLSIWAALAAAAWTSRGESEAGRGREPASSGKLRMAELPLMLRAATSWARAAISGVGKVPSQMRDFFRGSRISDTHLPQFLIRTPRYTGCLLESLPRFAFFASGSVPGSTVPAPPGEDGEEEEELVLVSLSEFDGSAMNCYILEIQFTFPQS